MSTAMPKPAACPFCGAKVKPPKPMDLPSYEASDGGECICGAFYTADYTSHNLGRAMLDAYCYAAGGPDQALDLDPDTELDEAVVEGYQEKTNTMVEKKSPHYAGASLYFVRLRPGVAERLGG